MKGTTADYLWHRTATVERMASCTYAKVKNLKLDKCGENTNLTTKIKKTKKIAPKKNQQKKEIGDTTR